MRRRGHTELSLLGGEPTLHPDIERIVALGKSCGYERVSTFSNGQRFSDLAFTVRMKAGLFSSCVSVHGHTAALHDSVTGVSGSFAKAVKGVKNLVAVGLSPLLICVVQKKNFMFLREYAEFFWGIGVRNFTVFSLKHQGRVLDEKKRAGEFLVSAPEAASGVRKMFGFFRKKAAMPPMLEHFPPCVLPGYESRMADYYPDSHRSRDAHCECLHPGEDVEVTADRAYRGRVFPDSCSACVYMAGCNGIDPNYLAAFGASGLSPVYKAPPPFYSKWGTRARKAALLRFSAFSA